MNKRGRPRNEEKDESESNDIPAKCLRCLRISDDMQSCAVMKEFQNDCFAYIDDLSEYKKRQKELANYSSKIIACLKSEHLRVIETSAAEEVKGRRKTNENHRIV